MKTIITLLMACLLWMPSAIGQKLSALPEMLNISPGNLMLVSVDGGASYKITFGTLVTNLENYIVLHADATNAVVIGSNLSVTNATVFGVYSGIQNTTNMQFFSLKEGTNMVLYRDGSNIVINSSASGTGGSGDVTTAQLNTASNFLYSTETTRNAAVSNSIMTLLVSSDTTTSNGLMTILVANDTTTSNGLFSVETTRNAAVSNATISFTMTTSNTLRGSLTGSPQMTNADIYITAEVFGNAYVATNLFVTNTISAQTLNVVDFNANNMIVTNGFSYTPTQLLGVGGANTNFTGIAGQEMYINAFTNVSLRAIMSYDPALAKYWTLSLTNFSGSDRTLEFSPVTNSYRFQGVYGTNAPSVITNGHQLILWGRSLGTNTTIKYDYFVGP